MIKSYKDASSRNWLSAGTCASSGGRMLNLPVFKQNRGGTALVPNSTWRELFRRDFAPKDRQMEHPTTTTSAATTVSGVTGVVSVLVCVHVKDGNTTIQSIFRGNKN